MRKSTVFTGSETSTTHENNRVVAWVKYHETIVACWHKDIGTVTFNCGGWHTATTVKRINQFCAEYSLPFQAYRNKGQVVIEKRTAHETYAKLLGDFPQTFAI